MTYQFQSALNVAWYGIGHIRLWSARRSMYEYSRARIGGLVKH